MDASSKSTPRDAVSRWCSSWTSLTFREWCGVYNWCIVFAAVLVNLMPLFIDGDKWRRGEMVGNFAYLQKRTDLTTVDSAQLQALLTDDYHGRVDHSYYILIGALNMGVAVPSVMDLLVDISNEYMPWGAGAEKPNDKIVRLSLLERSVFLIGVLTNGFFLLFPSSWNIMVRSNIDTIFNNMPCYLQIAPIIIFLERSTQAFSPLVTSFLVTTNCAGTSIAVLATLFCVPGTDFVAVRTAYVTVFGLSTWGTVTCCLISLYTNVKGRRFFSTRRKHRSKTSESTVAVTAAAEEGIAAQDAKHKATDEEDDDDVQATVSAYDNFNLHAVPAMHMAIMCSESLICFFWYYFVAGITLPTFIALNVIFIIQASLVMVIEMRVRANEVRHGLDMLESKRSFVRFISHEVRTPLSTAVMGLELLGVGADTSSSKKAKQAWLTARLTRLEDHLESLHIIYDSIRVAEAIFDDLIVYDAQKHLNDSDTLSLTYHTINATTLVESITTPLALNAHRNGVELTNLIPQADPTNLVLVDVDQRRISQALRTLIAAAIARTAKQEVVIVTLLRADKLDHTATHKQLSQVNLANEAAAPKKLTFWKRTYKHFRRSTIGSSASTGSAMDSGKGFKYVVVSIAHGGPGFEKAEARRINHDLFTFNPNEIHGGGGTGGGTGSGLGLSLAKTIVEAHGGSVWVQSDGVGKGSVFAMGLPISKATRANAMTRKEEIDEMVRSSAKASARKSFRNFNVQFALSDALRDQWLAKSAVNSTAPSPTGQSPRGDDVDGHADDDSLPGKQVSFKDLDAAAAALLLGKPAPVVSSARSQGSQSRFAVSTKGMDMTPSGSAATSAKEVATVESGATADNTSVGTLEAPKVAPARQQKSSDLLDGLHVLVVEDSPVARTMLVRLLKANGCSADEAEDGQQAVDKVRATLALAGDELVDVDSNGMSVRGPRGKAYDMILCDSVMPVMDGPTAVKIIREMGYTQAILGVTGNTLPEQVADFLAHGADDIVGKPVRQQVLKDAMKAQLLKKAQAMKS